MKPLHLHLPDPEATDRLGARLAQQLPAQAVIYLYGELGAGKTALVRALLHALGYRGKVRSPTYTLVEPYELPGRTLYHLDLYRVSDPQELEYLGLRELLGADAVCLVEWPQRGAGWLPPADLEITLEYAQTGRDATLKPRTAQGEALLA
jgi:tRNA threonylcarbamoyladenosine biosynthesis protein TsaE